MGVPERGPKPLGESLERDFFFLINHFKVNNSLEFGRVLAGGSI